MEGKEIKQQEVLGHIIITPDSKGNIEVKQHWGNLEREVVIVSPHKACEVAIAICPELQSELEKAKELLHESKLQIEYLNQKFTATGTSNSILSRLTTFLEGSGNKTK